MMGGEGEQLLRSNETTTTESGGEGDDVKQLVRCKYFSVGCIDMVRLSNLPNDQFLNLLLQQQFN